MPLSDLDPLLDEGHKIIRDVLCSLAKRGSLKGKNATYRLEGNLNKLIDIYTGGAFRHQYSMLYLILTRIDQEESMMTLDDLMAGLQALYEYAPKELEENKHDSFMSKFLKLYDHVSLEIFHIKHLKEMQDRDQEDKQKFFRSITLEVKQETEKALSEIDSVKKRLDSAQRDHIAILGIFAAIIMTSFTSFSLPSAIFTSVDKSDPHLFSLIVCLAVLFVANILHSLYELLKDMHFGETRAKRWPNPTILVLNSVILIAIMLILKHWF